MSLYVDTDDLKATLGIGNTDFANDDIDRAAAAASGIVDNICGRTFGITPAAGETRYFLPDNATKIRVDDLVTLTGATIDRDGNGTYEETLVANTDFRLGPPNAPGKDEPYTWLEAMPGVTLLTTGGGYLKLTGRFGWPAVPAEVVQATGILAARLLRRSREAPFAIVQDGAGGSARIGRFDPEVGSLLARYIIRPSLGSPQLG